MSHGLGTVCHQYFVTYSLLTWTDAAAECEKRGSVLMNLVDQNDIDFIHQWLLQVDFSGKDQIFFIGEVHLHHLLYARHRLGLQRMNDCIR